MKGIPARAEPAGPIFAERNPLALLSQPQGREQRMLAQRLDPERQPGPTLGGFLRSQTSGTQSVIAPGLVTQLIPGNFRVAIALAAAQLAECSSLGAAETVSILHAELAGRWTARKLRRSLLADRWLAASIG
jgi:hypothetical protein